MLRKLRVGVVGSGWVAENRHVPCWRNVGADIVAVCTQAPPQEARARLKVEYVTSDLDDLLRLRPDVVSVCSPPQLHLEHAQRIAERGIPILIEKPLVVTVDEAKALEQTLRRTGTPLSPAHSFRFCRATRQALDYLASGAAGDIIHVTGIQLSSFTRRLPTWFSDLPGGLYWDEAPHLVYLMDTFLGKARVVSSQVSWGDSTTPRTVSAELAGDQATGSLHMIFGSGVSEWHVTIVATNAVIDLDLFRDICVILPPDGGHGRLGVAKVSLSATAQHAAGFLASGWKHLQGKLYYGHDELIRRYAERLEPPVNVFEEGLRTVYLTHDILNLAGAARTALA